MLVSSYTALAGWARSVPNTLTFVADDGTAVLTVVTFVLLMALWSLAVSCCVGLVGCVERATHCHHHPTLHAVSQRVRDELRAECKDFCLRVASSNAAGQPITRGVALQHAFDAFGGSSSGLIVAAKENVRPELWPHAMRSLAIDVFAESNAERALLLTRCARLLDSLCQSRPESADGGHSTDDDDDGGAAGKCAAASTVVWQDDDAGGKGKETALPAALQELVAWSHCSCLRRHVCSQCGASDLVWVGHSAAEMAARSGVTGGYCSQILPSRMELVDDDLSPRFCERCRETIGAGDWGGGDDGDSSAPAAAAPAAAAAAVESANRATNMSSNSKVHAE